MKFYTFLLTALVSFSVMAEGAPAGGPGAQQNPIMAFMPFIIIFLIFYFLMIRPQKKRMEQEQMLLANLQKGDEIYTKAGLLGTITGMTEKVVTLEVADGVKLKVLRQHVGGLVQKLFENKEEKK